MGIIRKGSAPGASLQRTGLLFALAFWKAEVTSPNDPSHCALPVVRNRMISDSELILRALLNSRCLVSRSCFFRRQQLNQLLNGINLRINVGNRILRRIDLISLPQRFVMRYAVTVFAYRFDLIPGRG